MTDLDDFDKADLDGDGEFDAIDIMILEDKAEPGKHTTEKTGCAIPLVIGAGLLSGPFWLSFI